MELHERIKSLRKDMIKITQEVFASNLGVSRDTVNNWERGRINIRDYVLKLICKTYQVNYSWLAEEKGDPFASPPDILIDEVVEKYELDSLDRSLIEEYVKLPTETRNKIKEMLKRVFKDENLQE